MKLKVSSDLEYYFYTPGTLILNIHALRTPQQTVFEEKFSIEPHMKVEELVSVFGENRFIRVEVSRETKLNISYEAIVDRSIKFISFRDQKEAQVSEMDSSVLPYLYPSRYCQSDKLYRLANNNFGNIRNPYSKVIAITDWINRNIQYLSGSTNSQTSAYETITEQAGVCRDFAHLGIALCRACTIPARYFTGYSFHLKPPDFHACFEAYIGNEWILFDATKLAPLNGLVKIATGRDAADTSIASIFGNVHCKHVQVSTDLVDGDFEPFYYEAAVMEGLSYQ